MNNDWNNQPRKDVFDVNVSAGVGTFLRQVYLIMASAVAISALTSYGILAYAPQVVANIMQSSGLMWGLFLAPFILIFLVAGAGLKNSSAALLLLYVFSAVEGITFAVVAQAYTATSITMAFVAATVTFGTLAAVGTTTKKDFSGWGRHLFGMLLALVIVTLINFFLKSAAITYFFSFVSVVLFSGFTLYDAQNIKKMYFEANARPGLGLAVMGAFELYLDFLNLFYSLLRIFGAFDRD